MWWFESAPNEFGARNHVLGLFDAEDFEEGNDPAARLWGDELWDWMHPDPDDDDRDRGYPAGWLSYHRTRLADEIDDRGFSHPIFPLLFKRRSKPWSCDTIARDRVESGSAFVEQLIWADQGIPTLFMALRRERDQLRIRGADHCFRDGAPVPESWDTMDRTRGNRRWEVIVPWEAFWTEYEAAWERYR